LRHSHFFESVGAALFFGTGIVSKFSGYRELWEFSVSARGTNSELSVAPVLPYRVNFRHHVKAVHDGAG
jgi:hypothetical protein